MHIQKQLNIRSISHDASPYQTKFNKGQIIHIHLTQVVLLIWTHIPIKIEQFYTLEFNSVQLNYPKTGVNTIHMVYLNCVTITNSAVKYTILLYIFSNRLI